MNIAELQAQFAGRRFGELVLHHCKQQSLPQLAAGLLGTIKGLSTAQKGAVDMLMKSCNEAALEPSFWQRDCGEVLKSTTQEAKRHLAGAGGTSPTDDQLLHMFNTIVLTFAVGAHKDARAKRFIQESLGIGFFGRLFGG